MAPSEQGVEAGDPGGLSIRTVAGPVAWWKVAERVGDGQTGRAGQRPAGQHKQRWDTQKQVWCRVCWAARSKRGRAVGAGQTEACWAARAKEEPAVLELKPWCLQS